MISSAQCKAFDLSFLSNKATAKYEHSELCEEMCQVSLADEDS